MPGPKLNESPVFRRRPESKAHAVTEETPSARAVGRYIRVSPYKIRAVLDLIRGHDVARAADLLRLCERDAATVVGKILASATANAEHNHSLIGDELFVSACFADEGPTLKRWRPRARGRATRIRKRTCHVTVIVSRLPDSELRQRRAQRAQAVTGRRPRRSTAETPRTDRARRVRRRQQEHDHDHDHDAPTATPTGASAPAKPSATGVSAGIVDAPDIPDASDAGGDTPDASDAGGDVAPEGSTAPEAVDTVDTDDTTDAGDSDKE
ncbi:MAG: large subunit ribosomal protein [Actinomycetota bacterium]|jgi:large subunit ribosomal protein L22|nr:large subunit ribosomal protein [Actinomycetota bacterium]